MVKLSVAYLWGALCLFVTVEVSLSSSIDMLKEAAMKWKGPLVCENWDCDCALNRQRSCCCAANDMFDLEENAFNRMVSLWIQQDEIYNSLRPLIEDTNIAFKASFVSKVNSKDQCIGPYNTDVTVPYTSVSLNHGYGFNPSLSVFTAPRHGVYLFSITVYSHVFEGQRLYHKVVLMKDEEPVAGVWEDNREDAQDSSTQTVLLELHRGSQVFVKLTSGRWLCNNKKVNNNIFTGHLVYPISEMQA